jgi:hypothetical protein
MDLQHIYGGDLALSATGNLATATGLAQTNQTVARFIMTNPGDDSFNPDFGLGAGALVGETNAASKIEALILKGLKTLNIIDQTRPMSASVTFTEDGTTTARVAYFAAATGTAQNQTLVLG